MLSTDLTMVEKASKNVPSILDKKKIDFDRTLIDKEGTLF